MSEEQSGKGLKFGLTLADSQKNKCECGDSCKCKEDSSNFLDDSQKILEATINQVSDMCKTAIHKMSNKFDPNVPEWVLLQKSWDAVTKMEGLNVDQMIATCEKFYKGLLKLYVETLPETLAEFKKKKFSAE
jgi:hypothetical protein